MQNHTFLGTFFLYTDMQSFCIMLTTHQLACPNKLEVFYKTCTYSLKITNQILTNCFIYLYVSCIYYLKVIQQETNLTQLKLLLKCHEKLHRTVTENIKQYLENFMYRLYLKLILLGSTYSNISPMCWQECGETGCYFYVWQRGKILDTPL